MQHAFESPLAGRDDFWLNIQDLRQDLVSRANALVFIAAGATAILGIAGLPGSLSLLSLSLGAVALSIAVWIASERNSPITRHLLVWGMAALLVLSIGLFDTPWLPWLSFPLIFCAAIFISGADIVITVLLLVYTIALSAGAARQYPLAAMLVVLPLGLGLARLAISTLYTSLRTAWTSQRQADHLLAEARERQAELSSALKSLELATYQLETANRNLFIARRQTEEARRTKEQFAASISHELRTPLNVILGFSEMMFVSPEVYGEMAWPTSLRQDVYQIYRSSRHLLAMIDDVLELSRFELAKFALNREPTALEPLLNSAVEIVSGLFRDRPIRLETAVEPNLPIVEIDRTRIRQVIINLLTNARNYAKAGVVRLSAVATNGEAIISISDTGPGIAASKLPYIFDAFYQVDTSLRREQGGAGLGLAISKRFVEAHEGRIWVESQEGVGTTVCFSLPIPDIGTPTLYPLETQAREPAGHDAKPRVAVIDPDPAVAALLSRYLENFEVVQADSMQELTQSCNDHPARLVIRNVPPGRWLRPPLDSTPAHESTCLNPSLGRSDNDSDNPLPSARGNHGELPDDTPLIECSLPSRAWIARDLPIRGCLTKPITSEQLYREIERIGHVRDILIVDDDRGFAQLVERMLMASRQTYQVRVAFDGQEGLESARQRRPELIFLDLAMPVMDGFQVLAALGEDEALCQVPVVLLTVTSYAEDALMKYGSNLLVTRPTGLRLAELLRYLQAVAGAVEPGVPHL
ncbi:MAG: hybrid sensor histidine kinase/response regulator [Chloroflexi bacterium]|nr:hybrid sensor histidine kinase/response regulator [Chloroflexota bacterium]